MNRKWLYVVIAILTILILVAAIVSASMAELVKPGVRIIGRCAHVDLQANCYFVESNSLDGTQILGQSTFTAVGYVHDEAGSQAGRFDGHMNVKAYPISFEDGYRNHSGNIDNEWLVLSCQGIQLINPACETFYNVYILKTDPTVIVIHIFCADGENISAVCGETEEQAIANYQRYLETFVSD